MKDLETEEDLSIWLDAFYEKLLADPITAPKFADLNLKQHMPKLVQFWAFVLLDKEGYKTNVFEKHIHLHLEKIHFDLWLKYFRETTDALYKGEKAEMAKQRATMLAGTFLYKITGDFHDFSVNSQM